MNNWNGIGRLTAKPELRYTNSNKAVCEFNIAINRIGQEQTDFITCQVWNKAAENLTQYQDKGSLIAVSGTLRVDRYQDKEGNTRYKTYVLVSNIEYLGTKKEENAQNSQNIVQNQTTQPEADPFADFGETVSIDDNFLD